tara:strand:+ start:115 stop:978 length:864 start_codon:yes stop_codon:yes gene_type:complete
MKEVIFAGLAKNCLKTLQINLKFIENFKKDFPEINLSVLIMESDSVDGTKEFLKNTNLDWIHSFNKDKLDEEFKYRTEKIAYCRNYLFGVIRKQKPTDFIYIPIDFDIELFQFLDTVSFFNLLEKFLNKQNIDALFPYGYPYYYDIHALRAYNWNTKSPWESVKKINKFVPIGKFFTRYFMIYKKQKKYTDQDKLLRVMSAFGGIGLYKVNENVLNATYGIEKNLGNNSCEHVQFNDYFDNKFIDSSWIIPSPNEHIEFKLLKIHNKIFYIINSLFSDLKNLIRFKF